MKHLIVLILFLPALCHADKLILGGFSNHDMPRQSARVIEQGASTVGGGISRSMLSLDSERFNESHYSIGLQRDNIEYSIYYNSIEKYSFSVSHIKKYFGNYGTRMGLATGYGDDPLPIYQIGLFEDNYDISFGLNFKTLIFKVEI